MNKILNFLLGVLLLVGFTACNKNNPDEQKFVDLGLPSGTLWKSEAESKLYTFDEAKKNFGDMVPTQKNWEELYEYCDVKRIDGSSIYKYVGPSGDSILLRGSGRVYCDGITDYGSHGYYWTSTTVSEDEAIRLDFDEGEPFRFSTDYKCAKFSIRLIDKGE